MITVISTQVTWLNGHITVDGDDNYTIYDPRPDRSGIHIHIWMDRSYVLDGKHWASYDGDDPNCYLVTDEVLDAIRAHMA